MNKFEEAVKARFPKALVWERGDYGGQYRVVVLAQAWATRKYDHTGGWTATPGTAWASFHKKMVKLGRLPELKEQQS